MMKRTIATLFIIAALLSTGCKDKVKSGEAEVKRQTVSGVTITEVSLSTVDDYYETTGTVKAQQVSMVSARMMGEVKRLNVKEGDTVQKGQTLIIIDDSDVSQRVKAAQKAVEAAKQNKSMAEITYQRYKRMYDEKAVSGQEIDQIETQKKVAEFEYERASAMLAEAQVYQGFTRITAPQSGVVASKKIDAGSMAVPGAPLFVIEGAGSYYVEAAIDEGLIGKVKTGMTTDVIIDALNKAVKGRITEVIPSVDPQTRTFTAKIALSGPEIRSGLFARVKIPAGRKDSIMISDSAIVQKGQLTGVYAVSDKGLITYRLIKQGKKQGASVEVLSGLQPKDRIIIAGIDKAVDGGIVSEVKPQ